MRGELDRYPIEFNDIWHIALNNFLRICKMNGVINEKKIVLGAYLPNHLLLKEEPQRKTSFLSSIRNILVNLHSYAGKKVSDMIR